MSTIIPRFKFWNPGTWQIPKLYWDAFSDEQRLHAIAKQLGKVIAYADFIGVNTEDIAERLKAIEDGQLDEFIIAAVEAWFEEHEPEIVQSIQDLNDSLPSDEFNAENTVKYAIDAVQQNIDDLADDVEVIKDDVEQRLMTVRQACKHFVVIGDSFSVVGHNVTATSIWWHKFAVFMNMTPHVYSANGCGYIRGATPFGNLLSQAIADTSFDHDDVGYVIVYGSLNDCYQSFATSSYEDAVTAVINDAKTEFPNAEIVIAGLNSAAHIFSRTGYTTPGGLDIYHTTKGLEQTLGNIAVGINRVRFVPFARIMCGVPEWFNDNHPTPQGCTVIANAFENALTGAPMSTKFGRSTTSSACMGSGTLGITWNDSASLKWYANTATPVETTGGSGNYVTIFPIPYGLEGLLDQAVSITNPVSIAVTKAWPRTAFAYGYLTDTLPSYAPAYTPTQYVQSYLIQAAPSSATVGIRGL